MSVKKRMKTKKKKLKISKKQLIMLSNILHYISWLLILLSSVYGLCKSFHSIAILQHNIDLSYNIGLMVNDLNDEFDKMNNSYFIDYRSYEDRMQSGRVESLTNVYWKSIYRIDDYAFKIFLFSILLVFSIVFISDFKFDEYIKCQ